MPAVRPRRCCPALPLALCAGVAGLAVICLAFVPTPLAHAADPPRATAGFQTTDQLVLQVQLPPARDGKRDAVRVELLGPDGKVIDTATSPADPDQAALRVVFKTPKLPPGRLTVRTHNAGRHADVALDRILVARAHETTLAASADYFVGSEAALSIGVHGVRSLLETVPLAADVTVWLTWEATTRTLYTGKTGADGQANVRFTVPELPPGTYEMKVRTRSALGEETLKRQVRLQSMPKVLLTTDKPLYQPGQTIHVRALALRAFDLRPAAGKTMLFEIEDAKGNKVFKREYTTSQHGIAHVDFTLADEVNMGDYRVRAILGEHQSEKTVVVKKYVLPKFRVALQTQKSFYLPKEKVEGSLQVDYFFGKPVAGGAVEIKASTFDVAFKEFATWKGKTDKTGHVKFDVRLPDYFVGTPLAKGNAIVKLDVKVTDTAEHSEALTRTLPVSDLPIRVSLLPEGGRLIPGLENRLFVAATYPDGSPAQASVDVWLGKEAKGKALARLKTNAAGLAELKLTPRAEQFRAGEWKMQDVELLGGKQQRWMPSNLFDVTAEARDAQGNKARHAVALTSEPLGENVLLRLDRAIYKGGDAMAIDVRTSAGMPTVYVDVVKSGQTMLTKWLDVKDGRATARLDLPASVFGTLEVHAYQLLASGEVIRDARVVYVNPAAELKIAVIPDRSVYLPGAEGKLTFQVTDAKGKPTAAALGVLIVDEAVYAMQEIQPGLEKVFFTLQQELLKPLAQAVYRPGEGIDTLIRRPEVPAAKQQVAQALLTAVRPPAPGRWQIDPAAARRQKAREQVQAIGAALFRFADAQGDGLVRDGRTGKLSFKPDLLAAAVKAGHLRKEQLAAPLGGTMTLDALGALEPRFSPDGLATGLTRWRIAVLAWPVARLGQIQGGRWTIPADAIARAAQTHNIAAARLKDGWGRDLKVVKRPAGYVPHPSYPQFTDQVLASAGPDGKFGTADDVLWDGDDQWMFTATWMFGGAGRRPPMALAVRDRLAELGDRWGRKDGGDQMLRFRALPNLGGGPVRPGAAVPKTAPDATGKFEMKQIGKGTGGSTGEAGGAAPPRLREYFPETLLWRPALVTDDRGRATLSVPFADSITTWRLTASASSRGGQLGAATAPLRVFQDFFVDIDLPVALTQNDEVAFPVAVYNYLKERQTVTLDLKPAPWYELLDTGGAKRQLTLAPGEVTAVRFRIRAKRVGMGPLTVEARGSKMSDAVRRSVEVVPDGRAVEEVHNGRLKGDVRHTVTIPDNAIDGASRLFVKVYPGVVSQVMEGMEGMLRLPGG